MKYVSTAERRAAQVPAVASAGGGERWPQGVPAVARAGRGECRIKK